MALVYQHHPRNMKPWYRHGSRSPSVNVNGDWQEEEGDGSSNNGKHFTGNASRTSTPNEEEQTVISMVETISVAEEEESSNHDSTSISSNGVGNNGGAGKTNTNSSDHQSDANDANNSRSKFNHYRNNNNNGQHQNHSGYNNNGQYNKFNNNNSAGRHRQQSYGYSGFNNQRRQYNNYNNNGYNNYRNYGNNRRQQYFPNAEFYHSNQNYPNNHNNNGYYNRGGPRSFQNNGNYNNNGNSDSYNNGFMRRSNNNNNGAALQSPEFEEALPWPPKRGNWSHHHSGINGNYSFGNLENISRGYYSPNSRNCSPDISPTSDISGSFPPGQTRDIVLNNGSIITAQSLGHYDYFIQNQANSSHGFPYSSYPTSNYFYGYSSSASSSTERVDISSGNETLASSMEPPLTHSHPTTDSPRSSPAGSCTDSPTAAEKETEWGDDCTDLSDSESITTSASTRCNSPEEFAAREQLALTNDPSFRFYNNFALFSKDFSPTSTFCLRVPKRAGYPHLSFPREFFEDLEPDEIIKQFSKVVDTSEKPFTFAVENSFTLLDKSIWAKFVDNQQTMDTFRRKVELWRDVYRLVRYLNFTPDFKNDPRNFPFFGLQVVGSTMSGFGSNTSDVDMCLVIRDTEVDQRFEAVDRLQTLSRTLNSLPFLENVEMIYAKVPILKFRDAGRRLEVDLNCNNYVGIRNTHLMYAYAQMDWRLKPLVLVVKLWAQFHKINDAKMMTISSYSLALMVIHFLQHGLEDPVLPNLQKEFPSRFSNNIPILDVQIHDTMPEWESKNKMGLGELLISFLEYYARKFDYNKHVISVRTGGSFPIRIAANFKSPKNDFHQWKLLCIEEPFDRTNTARSVYDRSIFERIITVFYASWQRLLVSQSLDSIFTPFSEDDIRTISIAVANRLRC